ncbi:MAG: hypothetical protein FWE40_09180 [Oscillospiraceae bacterium]|nr:hypothetical protein [Oscillospiraceae bacterium]
MKIALLLVVLALLLVACSTPAVPDQPTTEELTTAYITTTQESTTELAYVYLTEAEIDEIFYAARDAVFRMWSMEVDMQQTIQVNDSTYFLVTDAMFATVADVEAMLLQYFAPSVVQNLMFYSYTQRSLAIDIDDALWFVGSDLGEPGRRIGSVRVQTQSETTITYQLAMQLWDGHDFTEQTHYTYERELINGRWVFTEFPQWQF